MEEKEQDVTAVVNRDEELPTGDDYTRIVEYKDVSNQASDASVYFIERDTDEGEPYYPVQSVEKQQRNIELYNRYKEMAEKEDGVTFIGGLANYKYFSMEESECYMCFCVDKLRLDTYTDTLCFFLSTR